MARNLGRSSSFVRNSTHPTKQKVISLYLAFVSYLRAGLYNAI